MSEHRQECLDRVKSGLAAVSGPAQTKTSKVSAFQFDSSRRRAAAAAARLKKQANH